MATVVSLLVSEYEGEECAGIVEQGFAVMLVQLGATRLVELGGTVAGLDRLINGLLRNKIRSNSENLWSPSCRS